MMFQLKIPKTVFDNIATDLKRPHKYALERVGFLYIRKDISENKIEQALATAYSPVQDDNYIQDRNVGAKINSTAIRNVMQRLLENGEGVLHVHMHNHLGHPAFSKTDLCNLPALINSFQSISPNAPNGALLLSKNSMLALVWLPKSENPMYVDKITIVGYPMETYRRC